MIPILLAMCLLLPGMARAEDMAVSSCLDEIKQACAGLEDHLENCVPERADQLTTKCRDLLENALSMIENNTGPAACVKDVKRSCPGVDASALASCIVEKKASFSVACRDYLDAAPASAADEGNTR